MHEPKTISRRNFLKSTAALTLLGAAGEVASPKKALAKGGAYATVIDITRCDGCAGEAVPRCVAACRRQNKEKFPEPVKPIGDLWPHKKHDDWSERREEIHTLTPYNWTFVQQVKIDGKDLFIPRRCMHCDNAPCANLCPFGALDKYKTGAVVINPNLCMGGAKCKTVCPWQIPQRQSGVGIYLKIQPLPAGGGVMYKCDLCQDLIQKGSSPACVAACGERLGENKPLSFGPREEMIKLATARAEEIGGYIYGREENGGTGTFYVSEIPFERITAQLTAGQKGPLFERVKNKLEETNRWAKTFLIAPMAAAVGASFLARRERLRKNHETKEKE